jgi:hypothetical protein
LALARPASAQAGVIHFQSYLTIIAPESNPCVGGAGFVLSGVDHLTFELTFDNAGSVFHSVSHQDGHLTGTDNQGNEYIGNLAQDTFFNGLVGQELTDILTIPIVSLGAAPNFTVHATRHFTVNADGTVTAWVNDVIAICQS